MKLEELEKGRGKGKNRSLNFLHLSTLPPINLSSHILHLSKSSSLPLSLLHLSSIHTTTTTPSINLSSYIFHLSKCSSLPLFLSYIFLPSIQLLQLHLSVHMPTKRLPLLCRPSFLPLLSYKCFLLHPLSRSVTFPLSVSPPLLPSIFRSSSVPV